MQEGVGAGEGAGAEDGVAVAGGAGLLDEVEAGAVAAGGAGIGVLVAGRDDHGDVPDAGAQDLIDDDAEHGLFDAIAVDQGLQREIALRRGGGGDDGFTDLQWVRS